MLACHGRGIGTHFHLSFMSLSVQGMHLSGSLIMQVNICIFSPMSIGATAGEQCEMYLVVKIVRWQLLASIKGVGLHGPNLRLNCGIDVCRSVKRNKWAGLPCALDGCRWTKPEEVGEAPRRVCRSRCRSRNLRSLQSTSLLAAALSAAAFVSSFINID